MMLQAELKLDSKGFFSRNNLVIGVSAYRTKVLEFSIHFGLLIRLKVKVIDIVFRRNKISKQLNRETLS